MTIGKRIGGSLLVGALALLVTAASPVAAQPATQVIRVEALIDGRSQLILRDDTAQWFHIDWAAPGRELFRNEPTIINGVSWFPIWPDVPDAENLRVTVFAPPGGGRPYELRARAQGATLTGTTLPLTLTLGIGNDPGRTTLDTIDLTARNQR